jgi:hypothetical protein
MRGTSFLGLASVWAVAAFQCVAQSAAPPQVSREIEVSLESRRALTWQVIDPQTVLRFGEEIRFRFRSNSAAYLYVFSISSSGEQAWLFPRPGQEQANRVEPRAEYMIPGPNGSFVVGGSAGFDIVYWVVSLANLNEQIRPLSGAQPSTLRPRCREGPLKARGVCLDEHAGPSPVQHIENLPFAFAGGAGQLLSRDLTFRSEDGLSRVTPPDKEEGVLVYELRIAHR